jgi:hypothetical protein
MLVVVPDLSTDGTRRSGQQPRARGATWAAAQRVASGPAVRPRAREVAPVRLRQPRVDLPSGRRCSLVAAARAARRCAASSWWLLPAADGNTRTTTSVPGRSNGSSSRRRWRSRRRTVLRVTALPTARGTTNPARGRVGSSPWRTCTTRPSRPARRPPRITAAKSSERRSRWSAASTVGPVPAISGRQALAPLGTARGDDGSAGPGAHPQPEAVGLRTPTVVRLVGALAHWSVLREVSLLAALAA